MTSIKPVLYHEKLRFYIHGDSVSYIDTASSCTEQHPFSTYHSVFIYFSMNIKTFLIHDGASVNYSVRRSDFHYLDKSFSMA